MSATIPNQSSDDSLDLNGRQVHAFAVEMENLGYQRLVNLLVSMFNSGAWRTFQDGLGVYEFLPGEFDYFLTQQGVAREDVLHGIRDIDVKAQLEAAMDERRTGEEGYRRHVDEAREANPHRPAREILPFGYTRSESKKLANEGIPTNRARPALGSRVRRWRNSQGKVRSESIEKHNAVENIHRLSRRLNDQELALVIELLKKERRRRKRE